MVRFLIIGFPQNICDDDYYIICLLCGNYTSLHCSMLSTHCVKATVPSIRGEKIGLVFRPINWLLTLSASVKYQETIVRIVMSFKRTR